MPIEANGSLTGGGSAVAGGAGGHMIVRGQPSATNTGAWAPSVSGQEPGPNRTKPKAMGRRPYSGKLLSEVTFSTWSAAYEKER